MDQPSDTNATPDLRGMSRDALADFISRLGQKPFRARQIFAWLHRRGARSFDEMTDLSLELRQRLAATALSVYSKSNETQINTKAVSRNAHRFYYSHISKTDTQ